MNRFVMRMFLFGLFLGVLMGCAGTSEKAPPLSSFQTKSLPTGSTDAATFAAKTY